MSETAIELLDSLAKMPREGHDEEWLHFIRNVLKLQPCYLPAAQEVLEQGRWRHLTGRGQNPVGYVKTATMHQAMRMGLALDKYTGEPVLETEIRRKAEIRREERLVISEDERGGDDFEKQQAGPRESEPICDRPANSRIAAYNRRIEQISADLNCIAEKKANGVWRAAGDHAEDPVRDTPIWLQVEGEYDAIDWETVAAHAVTKPRMARAVAVALTLRNQGISRAAAMAGASSQKEAGEIEAAWKWVDRYQDTRIAPLFHMQEPPEPEVDTSSFSMLTENVSLRVNVFIQWDGAQLILVRRDITPRDNGAMPAHVIAAESMEQAMQILRAAASEVASAPVTGSDYECGGGLSELFHLWRQDNNSERLLPRPQKRKTPPASRLLISPAETLRRVIDRHSTKMDCVGATNLALAKFSHRLTPLHGNTMVNKPIILSEIWDELKLPAGVGCRWSGGTLELHPQEHHASWLTIKASNIAEAIMILCDKADEIRDLFGD